MTLPGQPEAGVARRPCPGCQAVDLAGLPAKRVTLPSGNEGAQVTCPGCGRVTTRLVRLRK